MPEVVLDTETTGLDAAGGDRIVEIGMVEIREFARTGRVYQQYINPLRSMSQEAREVHGLEDVFLMSKPVFAKIADEFLEFIGDSRLVVHNAEFDMGFINQELKEARKPVIELGRVTDTLSMAQKNLPNLTRHNLDALCRHFNVDYSNRVLHGALLDAELLTDVYFSLQGANQDMFQLLGMETAASGQPVRSREDWVAKPRPRKLPPRITPEELEAHRAFREELGEKAIWNRYK